MKNPKITLRRESSRRIRSGHLWIFSNELNSIPKYEPGTVVEVFDYFGNSYGYGFYNPASLISVRILDTNSEIGKDFFVDRIRKALSYRQELVAKYKNYRLVYGESDYLPGLVIDKYENCFVLQIMSYGMELRKHEITQALLEIFPDTLAIISKGNSKLREIEGLSSDDDLLFGIIPDVINTDDFGIKLEISLAKGQKTGYFLDQRYNRYKIREFALGKKVLDCFTNQGGFALNAAYAGATEITAVDSSGGALELARKNAEINNYKINFVQSDVFDFLDESYNLEKKYDIVVLDPPAFTKNKKTVKTALAAYSKLNKFGMRVVENGGYLFTSSCSQHISEDELLDVIMKEASKLSLQLKLIHRGDHAIDHPVLLSMPETKYLKFFIFKIEYRNLF